MTIYRAQSDGNAFVRNWSDAAKFVCRQIDKLARFGRWLLAILVAVGLWGSRWSRRGHVVLSLDGINYKMNKQITIQSAILYIRRLHASYLARRDCGTVGAEVADLIDSNKLVWWGCPGKRRLSAIVPLIIGKRKWNSSLQIKKWNERHLWLFVEEWR